MKLTEANRAWRRNDGQWEMAKDKRSISSRYRRGDAADYAGLLTDRLEEHFTEHRVSRNID